MKRVFILEATCQEKVKDHGPNQVGGEKRDQMRVSLERKRGGEMGKRRAKRDSVNYTLRQGRNVVYYGVTNEPARRKAEHKNSGKRFTSMATGVKISRGTAQKRERKRIKRYRSGHGGRKPRYNRRG